MLRFLALAVLAISHYTTAHVTFTIPPKPNNPTASPIVVTYPTFDYFQASGGQLQYRETGIAVPVSIAKYGDPCTINIGNIQPAIIIGVNNATSTIAVIRELDFYQAGCQTIAQVASNMVSFSSTLEKLGYPRIAMILYLLEEWQGRPAVNLRGGPNSEAYQAKTIGTPDGTPAMPVALLMPENSVDFIKQQAKGNGYKVIADIKYEPGTWNTLFTSPTYYAFVYVLVGLNAGFVFYGLVAVGKLIVAKQLKFERRNLIFLISAISALLLIVSMPMQMRRQTTILLGQFSTIMFTIAFYLLLYTWNWLFAAIHPGRCVRPQRIIICLSGGLLVGCYIIQVVDALLFIDTETRMKILPIALYGGPALQLINALIFVYFTVVFCITGRKHRINGKTYSALIKLSYIGAVGFAGVLMLSAANFIVLGSYRSTTPSNVITMQVLAFVGYTLRSVALLFIFGVRMPSKRAANPDDSLPLTSNFSSRFTPIRRLARRFGLSRTDASSELSYDPYEVTNNLNIAKSDLPSMKEAHIPKSMSKIIETDENGSSSDATLYSDQSDNEIIVPGPHNRKFSR